MDSSEGTRKPDFKFLIENTKEQEVCSQDTRLILCQDSHTRPDDRPGK